MDDVSNLANEFLDSFTNEVQKRSEKNESLMREISEIIQSNEKEKQKIETTANLSVNLYQKLEEITKM